MELAHRPCAVPQDIDAAVMAAIDMFIIDVKGPWRG
jgi:hypothetical protein